MIMTDFPQFLSSFVAQVASKSCQLNKARWILETTGSPDAADLTGELDREYRLLFNDRGVYQKLEKWAQDSSIDDPVLRRQLDVLLRSFKQNMAPQDILEKLTSKEAHLQQCYANFRPQLQGKALSENQIREILQKENDPTKRQEAWETSKQIGEVLAPQILELVKLRNQAAKSLGYANYFTMQLALQEVDESWLFALLEQVAKESDSAYQRLIQKLEEQQCARFKVKPAELGPWAWGEPFGQEDPFHTAGLEALVQGIDICQESVAFYSRMGIDVTPVLARSDMFEKEGKNQHAFCMNIDRGDDIRTLNNVRSTLKWFETVLHEFGHAVYDMGLDRQLPWLLREHPHLCTTEAMALMAGRQAYRGATLRHFTNDQALIHESEESLRRRQLIFSRWVLVMTYFEKSLYENPDQQLNLLWIQLVERYQLVKFPKGRELKADWAAKYHIGLAPVYYYSYLLGEMLASSLEAWLARETGNSDLSTPKVGALLNEKFFAPGNRQVWTQLVQLATGRPFTPQDWMQQFVY